MSNPQRDFYVGYLALPPRLRLVIAGLVLVLFALLAFDAWLYARLQPEAGNGRWADAPTDYVGTLYRDPYPSIRVNVGTKTRTYVLISEEKRGAEAELQKFADGTAIHVQGYEIGRAAVAMVQLAATSVNAVSLPASPRADREILGQATLEGEIVDSKCWLGVMRPGDGHIHKACASICIRGGIPPMFVTRDGKYPPVLLMTLPDGRAVPPETILDLVADPVTLSGVIEKRQDIYVFKADLSTLRRKE